MVASVLVGMLCAHLLCFAVMFLLISKRLHGQKMGMDLFALGNFLLGSAYVLQLLEGGPAWSPMSVVNHTLTLASPVVYWLGAMRFFGHAVPLLSPLLVFAALYSLAQVLVQWSLGPVARYAMLSGGSALLFFVMALTVIYGARTFAKDLYGEMVFFAALISGLCVLNALKFMKLLDGGLDALQMDRQFQLVFYIYMSFLATVLPPSIVWLVLRRLTDQLRHIAARDPMTQLLNRRGLTEALQLSFNQRRAEHAHLLVVDVDHFKRINDTYGHAVGDIVIQKVAEAMLAIAPDQAMTARFGGEEFVMLVPNASIDRAQQLAEKVRTSIERLRLVRRHDKLEIAPFTISVGVALRQREESIEPLFDRADKALYRAKHNGRNCVVASS